MINPNSPRTELKISITRIFTKLDVLVSVILVSRARGKLLQGGICCVGQSCAAAIDADGNTTYHVA